MFQPTSDDSIKLLVIDSTRIGTQLLQTVLSTDPRFRIMSFDERFPPPEQASKADVVLLSTTADEENQPRWIEFARRLRLVSPDTKLVMLIDRPRRDVVLQAFRAGARGLFCRSDSLDALQKCIHSVHQGQVWASSTQIAVLLDALQEPLAMRFTDVKGNVLLSDREQEVVRWVAEGLTNREIAERLNLSEHTIKNYLFRIFEKLGISSRVELIVYGMSQLSAQVEYKRETLQDGNAVFQWCNHAIEHCSVAPYALARMYQQGLAVERSAQRALMWFLVAEYVSAAVSQRSRSAQAELRALLTLEQNNSANDEAREWLAKIRVARDESIEVPAPSVQKGEPSRLNGKRRNDASAA